MIYYKLKYIFKKGEVVEVDEMFKSDYDALKCAKSFKLTYDENDLLGCIVTAVSVNSFFVSSNKLDGE